MRPFVAILGVVLLASMSAAADHPANLRVMTFNIRTGGAADGPNRWDLRKDIVIETIRKANPDLLGVQEALPFQVDFLNKQLDAYDSISAGRDDEKGRGESTAIFYRKSRFELLKKDTFWLSPTPDKPGKGWDAALPRIVTWGKFKDKALNATVYYFNTHWDHKGDTARVESAKLMRKTFESMKIDGAILVTGDFNSSPSSEQYKILLGDNNDKDRLLDSCRELHGTAHGQGTTNGGFSGNTGGARIDWVLHSPQFRATECEVDRFNRNGHYPSDHFPVTAVLEYKP